MALLAKWSSKFWPLSFYIGLIHNRQYFCIFSRGSKKRKKLFWSKSSKRSKNVKTKPESSEISQLDSSVETEAETSKQEESDDADLELPADKKNKVDEDVKKGEETEKVEDSKKEDSLNVDGKGMNKFITLIIFAENMRQLGVPNLNIWARRGGVGALKR